eukprot:CCRYP_003941-RA/>CCRYP_003941-RA protein AED:0.13 eAED:0.13 QI:52/1/1/1/1/1/2/45/359
MTMTAQRTSQNDFWSDFASDVYSGITVGLGHPTWFVVNMLSKGWRLALGGEGRDAVVDNHPTNSKPKGLQVVGVGYGRTGTYSLALALDALGFPTLHTQHLYENDAIFNHLVKDIFHNSIAHDEIIMGTPNFDLLIDAGFTGTMDLPFALYYTQIRELYPDCKFILTVRENSEVWFKSWNVMTSSITQPAMYTSFLFSHVKKLEWYMRWLFSVVNQDKIYLTHPFPLPPQDKQKSIASYEKHNQHIRNTIPSTHLLEYNVRDGWGPLCRFLEVENCPSDQGIPFPKTNSSRAVQIQSFSAFLGPLILSVFVVFTFFMIAFRKVTGMSVLGWCSLQKRRFLRFVSNLLRGGTGMQVKKSY